MLSYAYKQEHDNSYTIILKMILLIKVMSLIFVMIILLIL